MRQFVGLHVLDDEGEEVGGELGDVDGRRVCFRLSGREGVGEVGRFGGEQREVQVERLERGADKYGDCGGVAGDVKVGGG